MGLPQRDVVHQPAMCSTIEAIKVNHRAGCHQSQPRDPGDQQFESTQRGAALRLICDVANMTQISADERR